MTEDSSRKPCNQCAFVTNGMLCTPFGHVPSCITRPTPSTRPKIRCPNDAGDFSLTQLYTLTKHSRPGQWAASHTSLRLMEGRLGQPTAMAQDPSQPSSKKRILSKYPPPICPSEPRRQFISIEGVPLRRNLNTVFAEIDTTTKAIPTRLMVDMDSPNNHHPAISAKTAPRYLKGITIPASS